MAQAFTQSGLSKRELAFKRSQFYRAIRDFFDARAFVEVETPVLSESLIPESAIEVFASARMAHGEEPTPLYLTPSPEIYMKQLIAEGIGNCYQMTKSFRNGEHLGHRHQQEFTMLEWYAIEQDYKSNLQVTQELLQYLAPLAHEDVRHLFTSFRTTTMKALFVEYVDINLDNCDSLEDLKAEAIQAGFDDYAAKAESWEELFHFIFISHIENKLPQDKTLFICDYPAQIPTTAKQTGQYYERWEFYMKGWEIANCYSEEASYDGMHKLFLEEQTAKQDMLVPHAVSFDYLDIFKDNQFPACSGCALGVDRLFALALNAKSLADVNICKT